MKEKQSERGKVKGKVDKRKTRVDREGGREMEGEGEWKQEREGDNAK